MAAPLPEAPDEYQAVVRRILRGSCLGYLIFGVWTVQKWGWWPLTGLTCAALVAIINFLWLGDILGRVFRTSPSPNASRLAARVMARFVLLGGALTIAIFVARFNAVSVVLGFSVVVVGIVGEALYSLHRTIVMRD